jgi:hypothetical protein
MSCKETGSQTGAHTVRVRLDGTLQRLPVRAFGLTLLLGESFRLRPSILFRDGEVLVRPIVPLDEPRCLPACFGGTPDDEKAVSPLLDGRHFDAFCPSGSPLDFCPSAAHHRHSLAGGVGFEPTYGSPRKRFSRPPPSSARPPSRGQSSSGNATPACSAIVRTACSRIRVKPLCGTTSGRCWCLARGRARKRRARGCLALR